jgi:hypothetical protein
MFKGSWDSYMTLENAKSQQKMSFEFFTVATLVDIFSEDPTYKVKIVYGVL